MKSPITQGLIDVLRAKDSVMAAYGLTYYDKPLVDWYMAIMADLGHLAKYLADFRPIMVSVAGRCLAAIDAYDHGEPVSTPTPENPDPKGSKRLFTQTLFLGNGEHSKQQAQLLVKRLQYAISLLGILQQPGHPESEADALLESDLQTQCQDHLKTSTLDIIAALGWDTTNINLQPK